MKKIGYITLVLSLSLFSTAAFASETGIIFTSSGNSTVTTGALADYRTSHNVEVTCASSTAAYAAIAAHQNGDRQFGATSGRALVYYKTKTVGSSTVETLSGSDSAQFDTGWSSL